MNNWGAYFDEEGKSSDRRDFVISDKDFKTAPIRNYTEGN
jgi:hypothetical protein